VYLDGIDEIQSLERVVALYTNKTFMQGEKLPYFSTRKMFLTDHEYFGRLVEPFLKAYVECGLQARWIRYSQVKHSYNKLKDFAQNWAINESTDVNKLGPILGHLLTTSHSNKGSFKSKRIPEPIHFDHFITLGKPLFYVLLIPGIVFLSELCRIWAQQIRQQITFFITHIYSSRIQIA